MFDSRASNGYVPNSSRGFRRVTGGFPGQPQRKYDPYSSMYNPGWRDHLNLSYGNPQNHPSFPQCHPTFQQYQSHPLDNSQPKLLIQEMKQFQQKTRASVQRLDNQMGHMATTINRLEAQSSWKLPSQMVVNPKENVSVIVLRSGKEVEAPARAATALSNQEKEKDITLDGDEVPKRKFPPLSDYKPVPLFPNALAGSRQDEQFKDFYETFHRCEANIPLFNALKQVPHYAKFLKELCNTRIEKAILDLGASINVMPYSIYAFLKLGPLNKTGVVIQLADRSNAYPKGVVEDVLVQVNDLVFPTDFYVLDIDNGDQTTPILLGRPFLKTSKTKIDVYSGTLTMEFDGKIVKLNIYDAMKYPTDDTPICSLDAIDSLAQEIFELNEKDGLEVSISKHLEKEEPMLNADLQETVAAPIQELKPLPSDLKYVFLEDGETLPVIISSSLSAPQEEQLVQVLKEHKTTIGWMIEDIKGISPSTCMHHILFEEQAKPSCQPQRRLNPLMMDGRGKHRKLQPQELEDPVYCD
ncbi:PREDICTED: uncharacterized protein LOC104594422 [Nelumbo nucifera]|uniref:Uncharacterized protein LOC104594422 n=1 Tax=Nelumbo nucifera TaxID=4432 RepID=A0A1U7ZVH1_NELNU|nr:PREDICTED: uncharacterized protein LOC104594422 [Nelumbo nucifera]